MTRLQALMRDHVMHDLFYHGFQLFRIYRFPEDIPLRRLESVQLKRGSVSASPNWGNRRRNSFHLRPMTSKSVACSR